MQCPSLLKALLAAGGMTLLITCSTRPAYYPTPEEDAAFEDDLRRCMGQPCEAAMLKRWDITSTSSANRPIFLSGLSAEVTSRSSIDERDR